jgi:vitamin B12 transporter
MRKGSICIFMKKKHFVILAGLFVTLPAAAQDIAVADEMVVTANRISQSLNSTLGDVTVIERDQIERAGFSSLSELLQRQPGISMSSNGGAGKASNIYLRGTNADHVVVLVDGIRINSATLGTFSFENMPLAQIERIEIVRGPASSLYGADAIGGVIQIFTRKGEGEGSFRPHAAVGMGSYHTRTGEAGFSGQTDTTRYGLTVSSLSTRGFSARKILADNVPVDKDDDGYWNLGLSAYLEQELAKGHSVGVQVLESRGRSHYDREQNFDNYGNQTLQSYSLSSKNQITDSWLSRLTWGKGIDDSDDHFKPTGSNPRGISDFRTVQRQTTWQNEFRLPLGQLTLAYDRLEQDVESTSSPISGYRKHRNNDGYVASYSLDHNDHVLQLSLREDHNTQYGTHTTGNVGYGYRFAPGWRVSANYGNAFKAPTFNQLYFPNFGDPELEPERSDNVETALRYSADRIGAGMVVFENRIRNLIENSGAATGGCTFAGFCPVNVGKAKIRGVTFDAFWQMDDYWRLSGNFTVQSPERLDNPGTSADESGLLTRRPRRQGTVQLDWAAGAWQVGAEITGASERYNDAANAKRMAGYALLNLTASRQLAPAWKLEMRADNVLDKDYILAYTGNGLLAAPYATPDANVFVGLRWQPQ